MPKWCNNTVVFEGKSKTIEQINKLFKSMAEQEQNEECGQLPDFIEDGNGGYFFEIYESDTAVFNYQTKWSPNTEVLQKIAERYNVNFIQDYEELGNCVYGRATFADKLLTDICLDFEDFNKYHFDEDKGYYYFEKEFYELDYDIWEILLKRKIDNHFSNIKIQNNETIR